MGIDGDRERGRVWIKKLRTEERAVTIYRRPHNTYPPSWKTQEKTCQDGARTSRLCGRKPWTRSISENRRNRRLHGIRIFICFHGM